MQSPALPRGEALPNMPPAAAGAGVPNTPVGAAAGMPKPPAVGVAGAGEPKNPPGAAGAAPNIPDPLAAAAAGGAPKSEEEAPPKAEAVPNAGVLGAAPNAFPKAGAAGTAAPKAGAGLPNVADWPNAVGKTHEVSFVSVEFQFQGLDMQLLAMSQRKKGQLCMFGLSIKINSWRVSCHHSEREG